MTQQEAGPASGREGQAAGQAGHAASMHTQQVAQPVGTDRDRTVTPTRWVGWIWFAAIMLVLLGVYNVIDGLVALFKDNFYITTPNGTLWFDLTAWGWIHLIIGVLQLAVGVVLFSGAMWARIGAVALAGLNAVAQLVFLSAYPVWSVIMIVLDIVVIWAVIVHGEEVDSRRWST